jgi:hypothetical protein
MTLMATLSGAARDDGLQILDTGDHNGDGATDMVVATAGEASGTLEYRLVFGQPTWPTESVPDRLFSSAPIKLPATFGLVAPGVPDGRFEGLYDLNGDGRDDIVLTRATPGKEWTTLASLVYFGRPDPHTGIDATTDIPPPEMTITQPEVSHDPSELCQRPLPAVLVPGDVDGDGSRDIVMFDCESQSECLAQAPGRVWVIRFDEKGMRSFILSGPARDPGVSVGGGVWGQMGDQLGCRGTAFAGEQHGAVEPADDWDGDGRVDILVTGRDWVYLFSGRDLWPMDGDVRAIASHTFAGASSPAFLDDLNGDGRPELKVRITKNNLFQANESIWFSRAGPEALPSTPDLELSAGRLAISRGRLGLVSFGGSSDLDGNGVDDLSALVERAQDRPTWEFRGFAGPVSTRGQIRLSTNPTAGQYTHATGGTDLPAWWPGDFDGDGVDDVAIVTSTEAGLDGSPGAGLIRIYRGPLDRSVPPTVTPSPEPSATASATASPTPPASETATTEPTSTSSPATPTVVPRGRVYLPLAWLNDARSGGTP